MVGQASLGTQLWKEKRLDLKNKIREVRAERDASVIVALHERAERARKKQVGPGFNNPTLNDRSDALSRTQIAQPAKKITFAQLCNARQSIPISYEMPQADFVADHFERHAYEHQGT
eukprot:3497233-Rhodomonas_salina.1